MLKFGISILLPLFFCSVVFGEIPIKIRERYPIPEMRTNSFNEISVLSYNIQLSGLDEAEHKWVDRKKAVIDLITSKDPDIVGLQELSGVQLADLSKALTQYTFFAINSVTGLPLQKEDLETQEGLAILYKTTLFREISRNYWWNSDTPREPSRAWKGWQSSFNKITQNILLEYLPNPHKVSFYNNHFAHDEDSLGRVNPRLESSLLELQAIQEDIKQNRGVISVGDRNTHFPRDEEVYYNYLKNPEIRDATPLHQYGLGTTFLGYENHPRVNPIVDGHFKNTYALDLVFYTARFFEGLQTEILLGEYDELGRLLPELGVVQDIQARRFASDHSGVLTRFKLKEQK